MKYQIGYILLFASVVTACWEVRNNFDREAIAEERVATSVADLAVPMIESGDVAGLSIGIVSLDESGMPKSETFHFGNANRTDSTDDSGGDSGLPTNATLYEIGGITNVFTGILLADAVKSDTVALETPAAELMPAGVTMPGSGDRQITLLDLVTHRSGLPRLAGNMPLATPGDPYGDYTSQLAGQFLNQYEPAHVPGTHFEYSNFAMSYLGHLLTLNSGAKNYESLLSDRLTRPLGMTSTTVQFDRNNPNLAVGHTASGREATPWTNADMPGAGGVRSTIVDMNLFMFAHLNVPDGAVGKSIDLAFEKHVDPGTRGQAMGLGWMISSDGMTRWHNGQTGGFHAAVFINRVLKLGVCVLSNTANRGVTGLAQRVVQFQSGVTVTVPLSRSRRDGVGYARLSPFNAVRWRDDIPEVQVENKWYELVSLNDLDDADISAFSRKRFGDHWKKRFAEDLVELLSRMGHPPKGEVKLVVKSLDSEETQIFDRVAMTGENRSDIYRSALAE
jgi:serine-type D-Ala-D-Ala carboxypeptidase/endopeptidase